MSAESSKVKKNPVLSVANVSPGRDLMCPDRNVHVKGTISGRALCKNVKAWRTQKSIIQASGKIFIDKEIIGGDSTVEPLEMEIDLAQELFPKLEVMYLLAQEINVGVKGEEFSTSQNIIFSANKVKMLGGSVNDTLYIELGKKLFQTKLKDQRAPKKFSNKVAILNRGVEADMEDFEAKARRPGNESAVGILGKLAAEIAAKSVDDSRIIALLNKVLASLNILTGGEIIQRWNDKLEFAKKYEEAVSRLKLCYKKLEKISANLELNELKAGAQVVILYGAEKHVIEGPLKSKRFEVTHSLVDDPESGLKVSDLKVVDSPM